MEKVGPCCVGIRLNLPHTANPSCHVVQHACQGESSEKPLIASPATPPPHTHLSQLLPPLRGLRLGLLAAPALGVCPALGRTQSQLQLAQPRARTGQLYAG